MQVMESEHRIKLSIAAPVKSSLIQDAAGSFFDQKKNNELIPLKSPCGNGPALV